MGFHRYFAFCFLAVLIGPASSRAQWREWVDLRTAVEDLAGALEERLECTFQGIQTNEFQACVDGSAQETVTNAYRAYGITLHWQPSPNSPMAWLHWQPMTNSPMAWPDEVRVSSGAELIVQSIETQEWLTATGTVQAVYTNWMTQDFAVTTNADCEAVTSEFASVVWTSPPPHYIPAAYMEALDAAIVTLSNPDQWGLYDPALFSPAAGCVTGWMWTVRDQWEPWSYTYPDAPDLLTHSQLCGRAGLAVTTYVDTVTDRGDTYPRTVSGGYYLHGWEVGDYSTRDLAPPVAMPDVIEPRYVTNAVTVGLWNYAPLYAMSNTARAADGSTVAVGRVLGRLSAARGMDWVGAGSKWQVRGLGASVDGIYGFQSGGIWTGRGHYAWIPGMSVDGMEGRYINASAPVYPADYLNPESNALWSSGGIAQGADDPLTWQRRGLAGCYTPVERPGNTMTTTGDVAPVAAWRFEAGEAVWGGKNVILQPAALPAYLFVTILSTNDRYCSGLDEPDAFPDPLTVEVVGTWWRAASATQGLTSITATQSVVITSAGRVTLDYPFTAISSLVASNGFGGTNFYSRELEITAHLGDYTNALSMINAPAAWWLNSGAGWEAFKPVLEDRKKMLSAMSGLAVLVGEREVTNTFYAAGATNIAEGECSSSIWDWPYFPYGQYVGSGFEQCGDNYYGQPLIGGPVGTDCVSAELEATPGGASPSTAWSISSMCAITLNRYDATIRIQENISYSEGAGEPAAYDSQWVASSYNRGRVAEEVVQKDTSRISGILTERVPGALSFYSRATPSGYANEKASVLSGITYQTTPKEGEGCSGDGSLQEVDERADEVVYRPKFYGVETLVLYGAASTVERDGFSFSVDVPHPEWPAGRMEYAFTNKATGAGAASFQCQSVDDFMDYSIEASFTASRTEDSTERKHYDGYSVEWFLSFAPAWRFQ